MVARTLYGRRNRNANNNLACSFGRITCNRIGQLRIAEYQKHVGITEAGHDAGQKWRGFQGFRISIRYGKTSVVEPRRKESFNGRAAAAADQQTREQPKGARDDNAGTTARGHNPGTTTIRPGTTLARRHPFDRPTALRRTCNREARTT